MFDYFGEKEAAKQQKFKEARDRALHKPVVFLTKLGIKPNHVTFLRFFYFL